MALMADLAPLHVGCAGWSIPAGEAARFPTLGTHLERYASLFSAVEINSSFYRPHKPQTYAKWGSAVPGHFRFAVKAPRLITHEKRLQDAGEPLQRFLGEVAELGPKLGPLLVQLPPSLAFDAGVAQDFFGLLRERCSGPVVCEPRHASWFAPQAEQLLVRFQVARVAADPALAPQAAVPGGWRQLAYYRLHGTPRIYYSAYDADFLEATAASLRGLAARSVAAWCIFDNTAAGAATSDALTVLGHL